MGIVKKRILYVDDDEMLREATTGILESLGYEVIAEEGRKGAISGTILKDGWTPDLILAESSALASIDDELAQTALGYEPPIPLVVITVAWENPSRNTPGTKGISSLIYKPFTREELIEALQGIPWVRKTPP